MSMDDEFEDLDEGIELHQYPYYIEIPKEFYSEATGKPFEKCSVCEKNLLQPETWYLVEKAVKRYPKYNVQDVVFEYAICAECHSEMEQRISTESKQKMQAYMKERVDLEKRADDYYSRKDFDVENWINKCAVSKNIRADLKEYQIVASFNGDKLAFTVMPLMLGMKALDDMTQLLSNKSLDELNDFKDRITDMPPDLKELFKESKFVMM